MVQGYKQRMGVQVLKGFDLDFFKLMISYNCKFDSIFELKTTSIVGYMVNVVNKVNVVIDVLVFVGSPCI